MTEGDPREPVRPDITPETLLRAYAAGVFPMAESAEDEGFFWVEPERRGIIPLDAFHVSKSLAKTIRSDRFEIRVDTAFDAVIAACAAPGRGRETTWISGRIRDLYGRLFEMGYCHTVEAWREERLVGGLYGLAIGGAFFGESMFAHERDASKVALAHLAARLKTGGFTLLDTQFTTEHLISMGAVEIARSTYKKRLAKALKTPADFYRAPGGGTLVSVLQALSQTS